MDVAVSSADVVINCSQVPS